LKCAWVESWVVPNPVPANSAVTLTAKVRKTYGAAIVTGTVTFSVGGAVVGTAPVDDTGAGTVNLSSVGIAAGTYPVIAVYGGDGSDGTSTSTTVFVTIE
jgi:hypothetical protein